MAIKGQNFIHWVIFGLTYSFYIGKSLYCPKSCITTFLRKPADSSLEHWMSLVLLHISKYYTLNYKEKTHQQGGHRHDRNTSAFRKTAGHLGCQLTRNLRIKCDAGNAQAPQGAGMCGTARNIPEVEPEVGLAGSQARGPLGSVD